jgi:tRNA-specific 2-thiouridylase
VIELYGDAGDAADWAWIRLTVHGDGRIGDACGEGDGVRSLASAIRGRTLLAAAAVPAPRLAADALAAAIGPTVAAAPSERRVAVAMSGGVDSAVALLEAEAAGLEPVGVTLRLWLDPRGADADRACCSTAAIVSARELCHARGVPHVTLDRRDAFRAVVVRPFVEGYASGETPNPCTRCNGSLRFAELLAASARLGARRLATGHYARLVRRHGRVLLGRGRDEAKDQSYMLGRVDPAELKGVWFPLGERTKAEVRSIARDAGLPVADRAESQEACFLAGDDYRTFLGRQGLEQRAGLIVDLDGNEVGRHDGFWRFTPGQRRGLAIASGNGPVYAIRTNPDRNEVVVGPRSALARRSVSVPDGRLYVPLDRAEAKLRYRSPAIGARVSPDEHGFALSLDEPVHGIAPGQTAVLYADDAVVGAGTIARAA